MRCWTAASIHHQFTLYASNLNKTKCEQVQHGTQYFTHVVLSFKHLLYSTIYCGALSRALCISRQINVQVVSYSTVRDTVRLHIYE